MSTPHPIPNPRHTPAAILRHLIGLAAPFWRWIALSTLLGALTIASSIALMGTSAWIISKAALQPSIADLQVAIVGVRFFGITRGVFRYLERLVSHNTTFKMLARLRVWFYTALEPLAPARLMRYRSGDLLSRIVADVNTLEDFYVRVLAPPLVAVVITVGMLIFMAIFTPLLAGVLLAGMVLLGMGVPLLTRWLGRAPGRDLVEARADLNAALVDGVQGMADVVAYGAQDVQQAQIAAHSARLIAAQRRMAVIDGLQIALGVLVVGLATVAVLTVAIPRVDGILLATLALATVAAFEAITPLPQTFQYMESNLTAAGRLLEVAGDAAHSANDTGSGGLYPPDMESNLTAAGRLLEVAGWPPSPQPSTCGRADQLVGPGRFPFPPNEGRGDTHRRTKPLPPVGEGMPTGRRPGRGDCPIISTSPCAA
jgi:ATP-binding cassette subfamily C protein CydC